MRLRLSLELLARAMEGLEVLPQEGHDSIEAVGEAAVETARKTAGEAAKEAIRIVPAIAAGFSAAWYIIMHRYLY